MIVSTDEIRSTIKNAPLVLIPQYFGSLMFERETSRYLPFDKETTALLRRLSDESFETICDAENDEGRKNQLWQFYEQFYMRGFFTLDGKFAGTVLDINPPDGHLTGPLAVHLEVAAICNLTCKHCFAGEMPRKNQEKPLTLNELDSLFAELAQMGSFRLGVTGGEPLLRKDLLAIIDRANHYGLHPCITTNGLLITEDVARELGKRDLLWLNVSLEGATAATNDAIRGKGTFDSVLDKLKILRKYAPFSLAFTITKSNIHEIKACAELAYQVGAETAVFRPLYPTGNALNYPELMPTYQEYHTALNHLQELSGQPFELCSVDPFSPQARKDKQTVTYDNAGCGAANQVCSISVSGVVNPCSFLGERFNAGTIREQTFADIWHHSPVFQKMRQHTGNFQGGCRARALHLSGSAHVADPWLAESDLFNPMKTLELVKEASS